VRVGVAMKEICEQPGIRRQNFGEEGKKVSICEEGKNRPFLRREMGNSIAENAMELGIGMLTIGMAIRKDEERIFCNIWPTSPPLSNRGICQRLVLDFPLDRPFLFLYT